MSTVAEDLRTEEFLEHYGIKGMKWGQKKAEASGSADSARQKVAEKKVTRKQNRQMNRAARTEFNEKKMQTLYSEAKKHGDKVLVQTTDPATMTRSIVTGKEFVSFLERGGAMDVRTTEIYARKSAKDGSFELNSDRIGTYQKQNFRKP